MADLLPDPTRIQPDTPSKRREIQIVRTDGETGLLRPCLPGSSTARESRRRSPHGRSQTRLAPRMPADNLAQPGGYIFAASCLAAFAPPESRHHEQVQSEGPLPVLRFPIAFPEKNRAAPSEESVSTSGAVLRKQTGDEPPQPGERFGRPQSPYKRLPHEFSRSCTGDCRSEE